MTRLDEVLASLRTIDHEAEEALDQLAYPAELPRWRDPELADEPIEQLV